VLRARRCPQSEEMVVRIRESPTAADGDEARIPDVRKDHGSHSSPELPTPDLALSAGPNVPAAACAVAS
jgi:hypothetical protein